MNTIFLKKDARQEILIKENDSIMAINFQTNDEPQEHSLRFRLAKNAKLVLWNLYFGTGSSRHVHEVVFEGEYAEAENHTVYFGRKKSRVDLSTTHIHKVPGGISRIASHGILLDESYARYVGLIKILQTAPQTDAQLEEKTLLLSSDAKVDAVPGLEIGTNDVRATHSAGVTRIDEEQLFYAASRGIDEKTAIRLIAEGFLKHAFQKLPEKTILREAEKIIHTTLSK